MKINKFSFLWIGLAFSFMLLSILACSVFTNMKPSSEIIIDSKIPTMMGQEENKPTQMEVADAQPTFFSSPSSLKLTPRDSTPEEAPEGKTTAQEQTTGKNPIFGEYTVSGTNPDSSTYKGSLIVTKLSDMHYSLSWSTGNEFSGIGILNENILSVGYGDENCGVKSYQIQTDGSLKGSWLREDGYGSEEAIPPSKNDAEVIDGEYTLSGNTPSGISYQGTLKITPAENGYHFLWQDDINNEMEGLGIRSGNIITAAYGGETCGFVAYQITPKGLHGIWGFPAQPNVGTEEATKLNGQ